MLPAPSHAALTLWLLRASPIAIQQTHGFQVPRIMGVHSRLLGLVGRCSVTLSQGARSHGRLITSTLVVRLDGTVKKRIVGENVLLRSGCEEVEVQGVIWSIGNLNS
jgi:hypothetical protein